MADLFLRKKNVLWILFHGERRSLKDQDMSAGIHQKKHSELS